MLAKGRVLNAVAAEVPHNNSNAAAAAHLVFHSALQVMSSFLAERRDFPRRRRAPTAVRVGL